MNIKNTLYFTTIAALLSYSALTSATTCPSFDSIQQNSNLLDSIYKYGVTPSPLSSDLIGQMGNYGSVYSSTSFQFNKKQWYLIVDGSDETNPDPTVISKAINTAQSVNQFAASAEYTDVFTQSHEVICGYSQPGQTSRDEIKVFAVFDTDIGSTNAAHFSKMFSPKAH